MVHSVAAILSTDANVILFSQISIKKLVIPSWNFIQRWQSALDHILSQSNAVQIFRTYISFKILFSFLHVTLPTVLYKFTFYPSTLRTEETKELEIIVRMVKKGNLQVKQQLLNNTLLNFIFNCTIYIETIFFRFEIFYEYIDILCHVSCP
jgi:hypothetical protein